MARRWYDHKAGDYIDWYVDNGTHKPFEVWLDGRLFRTVEPNDYVTKNYGDSVVPKFLRPKKQHTIEIRTPSSTSALETCSFVYPYDAAGQLLASDYGGTGSARRTYFIYNIQGANTYNIVEIGYSSFPGAWDFPGPDPLPTIETIRGQRCIFVRLDGVYASINDVPKSVSSYGTGTRRVYLLLRS